MTADNYTNVDGPTRNATENQDENGIYGAVVLRHEDPPTGEEHEAERTSGQQEVNGLQSYSDWTSSSMPTPTFDIISRTSSRGSGISEGTGNNKWPMGGGQMAQQRRWGKLIKWLHSGLEVVLKFEYICYCLKYLNNN